MIILPAIDLLNGRGVRLKKGLYNEVTDYGHPEEILNRWQTCGSNWLHIVDLNAAKQEGSNREVILNLLKKNISIQVGGGIRTLEDAETYLKAGAKRVIIGTILLKDEKLTEDLLKRYGDQIVVGVDAKEGFVAVEGWKENSTVDSLVLLKKLEEKGAKTVVYTDISKDGMMSGPNFEIYKKILAATQLNVIASGGITTLEDVMKLKSIGVHGAIIGKALYENSIDLKEAISC